MTWLLLVLGIPSGVVVFYLGAKLSKAEGDSFGGVDRLTLREGQKENKPEVEVEKNEIEINS